MYDPDATAEQVLADAANSGLPDDAFVMIRRALAGLDPITGEKPVPALPKRMTNRAWRKNPFYRMEVGQEIGWYWRCPRKSCGAWGGPYDWEIQAYQAGQAAHGDAHPRR